MRLPDYILKTYLDSQGHEVEVEEVDRDNIVVSFPMYISSHARVEVAITRLSPSDYLLSDLGQTLGEIQDAGFSISPTAKSRIEEVIKLRHISLDSGTLLRYCKYEELGLALNEFVEGAKTVGDVYLFLERRGAANEVETALRNQVRDTLQQRSINFAESQSIDGCLEQHSFDFYVPPNGTRGLALAVISNPNRIHSEAWGFRSQDIKNSKNKDLPIALFYNAEKANESNRKLLNQVADAAIPSNSIVLLDQFLERIRLGLAP